jgi:hypothetical protein
MPSAGGAVTLPTGPLHALARGVHGKTCVCACRPTAAATNECGRGLTAAADSGCQVPTESALKSGSPKYDE